MLDPPRPVLAPIGAISLRPAAHVACRHPGSRPSTNAVCGGRAESLARRLASLSPLSEEDRRAIAALCNSTRQHGAGGELCRRGQVAPPRALVAGWACKEVLLSDGRRQIISFILPGDLIHASLEARVPSSSVVALTAGETVDTGMLRQAAASGIEQRAGGGSGLAVAVRAFATMEEAVLRDHIVRLGRQTAYERLAHLLLELHYRLAAVGMTQGNRFAMPVTQETLAAAIGLTSVHVNRTVQQMRRDGLLEWGGGYLTLPRRDDLIALADWNPPIILREH